MPADKTYTARQAAWKTLNSADIARHDTSDILGRLLDRTDRSEQATDIVMGVIRHKLTIDRILKKCATIEQGRVKPSHWNLLRMGVYELVLCPRTAEYAILNETAELAHTGGSRKAAGFINAVLRNVQRAIESRQADLTKDNEKRLIPHGRSSGCLFRIELLGDFATQPIQYLQLAYSIPQELVQSWIGAYGTEHAKDICIASNRNPSVILQPNTLKCNVPSLSEVLQKDYDLNDLVFKEDAGNAVSIRKPGRLNRSGAYLEGLFYIQDTTAASTIDLLSPEPGWTIIDLCSAPGAKTAAMAMKMQDKGLILASDIDVERLKRVRQNAQRLGLGSIEILPASRIEETALKQTRLDAIVLDVPCSNTGVLARRVEARWRWSIQEMKTIVEIQQQLLEKAASIAMPGTRILYSTCSIQREENENQVAWFLEKHRKFRLKEQRSTFPATESPKMFDHDGGFAALIQSM